MVLPTGGVSRKVIRIRLVTEEELEMDIEWAVDFAKRARSHAAFKNSIINFIDEESEGN